VAPGGSGRPGRAAGRVPRPRPGPDRAEFTAAARRRELAARKAADWAAATGTEPKVAALAVSIAGDLPGDWRQGTYLVLPGRVAGLPRLVIGRPGQGKSVCITRGTYLAALAARWARVIDCKGEPGFATEVVDAYLAGRPDTTVHLWPDEPLNGWTGGPVAVVNRLLSCWEFDLASQWYREVVSMALRLAPHAPGPPVTSSAELAGLTGWPPGRGRPRGRAPWPGPTARHGPTPAAPWMRAPGACPWPGASS
jgi:hypothetical protein